MLITQTITAREVKPNPFKIQYYKSIRILFELKVFHIRILDKKSIPKWNIQKVFRILYSEYFYPDTLQHCILVYLFNYITYY